MKALPGERNTAWQQSPEFPLGTEDATSVYRSVFDFETRSAGHVRIYGNDVEVGDASQRGQ